MSRPRWFASIAVLLLVAPMGANAAKLDCAKADTQGELNICAAKELQNAENDLNRLRAALSKKISDPAAKAAMDEAEKAWEAYADAECRFESSGVAGADAEQMVVAYCQVQRARTRVNVLKRILECKEGDFTCPTLTH